MTEPDTPGLFHPDLRAVSIGATGLVVILALEYIAVGTAMPTVAEELDGLGLYALAFAATVAASIVGMILGGWWSDHQGPARSVVSGCLAFAAGLLVAGLAPTMEIFVIGRGLQGLGSGLAWVAVYVVIAQTMPDALRPQVFSLLAAAWVVPGLAGPVLAGAVTEQLGWRWVFLGVVPLTLLALWALRPALARTAPTGDAPYLRPATIVWALVAALSVAALNLAGEQVSAGEVLFGVPVVVLLVVAAAALLPAGTVRLWRGLPSVVAARGLIGASFIASEAYLPLLLQQLHGYTPTAAGGVLAVGSLTWAAGSWGQSRMADHGDRSRLLVGGCALTLIAAVLLVASVVLDWPGWTVLVIWGWASLGVGFAYPTTSLMTLRLSPPARVGANSSALQVSESLASALVLAGAGAAFAGMYADSARMAFSAVTLVGLLAAALALLTATRSRARVVG
ncbi:MAG: MFS transporter [Ornithinimicrobium sp.]|uniref:MFS transporter n=1 Tax=Ornithinimicrobium sp. TaxID=1977084 RepID=UPI0017F383A6|nr:MFS transporter [Actinomycetota bacterium]